MSAISILTRGFVSQGNSGGLVISTNGFIEYIVSLSIPRFILNRPDRSHPNFFQLAEVVSPILFNNAQPALIAPNQLILADPETALLFNNENVSFSIPDSPVEIDPREVELLNIRKTRP